LLQTADDPSQPPATVNPNPYLIPTAPDRDFLTQ